MKTFIRRMIGVACMLLGLFALVAVLTGVASAQTDIGSTLTSVNGYWTTAETLGIGILLFVIGRKVVKKI